MSGIDLHRSYNSSGESILDLFGQLGEGFFVPIYQREYTWEEENITRLFEDLVLGVNELTNSIGDHTATFLGTAILTDIEDRMETVRPGDEKAQPTAVRLVVDGQQRIATVSFLSIQLTLLLQSLENRLPSDPPYDILKNHSGDLRQKLENLYSFKLGRGAQPLNKPKIIRADEDHWEFQGDDSSYRSPTARYIANYLRTQDETRAFESVQTGNWNRVTGNVKLIEKLLVDISNAHQTRSQFHGTFPEVQLVTTKRIQELIFGYYDGDLAVVVNGCETDANTQEYVAVAIYQLFLLAYYLLERCGINVLRPSHQEWGFDMFQALNSTGTPLTAIETFRPDVIQTTQQAGFEWQDSRSKALLDDVEELFERTTSNEQKSKRTNELLSAARLCFDGEKLGNKFSAQHRWLRNVYLMELDGPEERDMFLDKLARVASFLSSAWYMEDGGRPDLITAFGDHNEAGLVSLLVQYLKDAGSGLSAPILAMYYGQIQDGAPKAEFVEATKACAAFFTLWRSARSTSGLDEIYRKFFHGSHRPVQIDPHNWRANNGSVPAKVLRDYFAKVLKEEGIWEKGAWASEASRFLRYNEVRNVCRFALFVAGHDQVPNEQEPGLTMEGNSGSCQMLSLGRWRARDHKSLEHVAPQSPRSGHGWDQGIYSSALVQDVGNLLLLPTDINSMVDTRGWATKFLHYSYIGNRSAQAIQNVRNTAQERGIALSDRAIKKLSVVQYSCAIEPIMSLGIDGSWDADFVTRRSQQIRSIVWDRLNSWLHD